MAPYVEQTRNHTLQGDITVQGSMSGAFHRQPEAKVLLVEWAPRRVSNKRHDLPLAFPMLNASDVSLVPQASDLRLGSGKQRNDRFPPVVAQLATNKHQGSG